MRRNTKWTWTFIQADFLNAVELSEDDPLIQQLKDVGARIVSTVPIRLDHSLVPLKDLRDLGLEVYLGNGNIYDQWNVLDSGDILEKAREYSEFMAEQTEQDLRSALGFTTKNQTALTKDGSYHWPQKGDPANFVAFDASCSAQVVAHVLDQHQRMIIRGGQVISKD